MDNNNRFAYRTAHYHFGHTMLTSYRPLHRHDYKTASLLIEGVIFDPENRTVQISRSAAARMLWLAYRIGAISRWAETVFVAGEGETHRSRVPYRREDTKEPARAI